MKTYLTDWIPVKQTSNLTQINVYSSWNLNEKDIKLRRVVDDHENNQVVVEYDVTGGGFTGRKNLTANVFLQIPWAALPADHKIVVKAYENAAVSDNELMDTGNAPEN